MEDNLKNVTNDNWLEFYQRVNDSRQFYAEKAWETIKFHILLSSSLISVSLGTIALLHTSEVFLKMTGGMRAVLILPILLLPLAMYEIIRVGNRNFDRECNRMYEQAAIIMKLEEKFGFTSEKRNKEKINQITEEEKYLPPRYNEKKWLTTKAYIDDMMSCCQKKDNLYCNMRVIFRLFKYASIALSIFIIVLILLHIHGLIYLPTCVIHTHA